MKEGKSEREDAGAGEAGSTHHGWEGALSVVLSYAVRRKVSVPLGARHSSGQAASEGVTRGGRGGVMNAGA